MDTFGNGGDATDLIGYSALTEAALKAVMREALKKVEATQELPGAHHFYITFRTDRPDVTMADSLRDRFPEEITIVVQHQFWDLKVERNAFEVVLKFSGVPQHLRVPFSAVTRFTDPSVNMMLPFSGEDVGMSVNIGDEPDEVDASEDEDGEEGTVISLDAFRRK